MKLAQPPILWFSFVATLVMTVLFQVIVGQYGLILLDAISDPGQARAAIADMSDGQRSVHAWLTATLDVAYPLVYGALFIGAGYRFFPSVARYIAMLVIALVGIDFLEGAVQVLALTDTVDWLDAKALLTPVKTLLFVLGLVMTLCGCLKWLLQKLRGTAGA